MVNLCLESYPWLFSEVYVWKHQKNFQNDFLTYLTYVTIDFFKNMILWLFTYMLIPKVVDNSARSNVQPPIF